MEYVEGEDLAERAGRGPLDPREAAWIGAEICAFLERAHGFEAEVEGTRVRGIIHGDRLCASIAAASIVAKVYRDRVMAALHDEDGRYGYARHKGYATPEHLAALERFGYSPHHRRSFRPASLFDKMPSGGAPQPGA
jgi:ribonuclease HII